MENRIFKYKIEKQLWYLNRREKAKLAEVLSEDRLEQLQSEFRTPGRFVTVYLKESVFKSRVVGTTHLFTTLIGLFAANIVLLGILITGMLLSLTALNHFIHPQVTLSTITVITALLSGIVLIILAVWIMKVANAFFTKRLVDYKFNKVD
ncbi:hypothetical protein [Staphylococcus americanisciuri]|uniref:Staphylococcal protein n=1 Tax=Staphylococcus americanisciuri TaxID=2973940 RepID=A0ABT2EYF2_9STAP|nr:hypothetical protein [Staphylococcus americanisciuri]MCS4485288.1 hypothetical protein [Staphylococcus americanisciuri]